MQTAMYADEKTADRAQTEWSTLHTQTELLAKADAEGDLRARDALIRNQHTTVMHLLDFGVPAEIIAKVTRVGHHYFA